MTLIFESLLGLTLHSLFAMLGLAVYVVASRALHQRRHPSAAVAWVVSLVLLPYVALPLYLMFGRRKLVSRRAVGRIHQAGRAAPHPDALAAGTRQIAAAMALPPARPYEALVIHDDGSTALRVLRTMIRGATRSLDLCTFVFARDALGDEIAALLEKRVADGIRVRLLVDGVGVYLRGHPDFKRLSAAGIQVALFVPPLRSSLRGRTNLRNHRKMVIADGEWLWCGGRNLASEYFEGDLGSARAGVPWTDLSIDLHGALALQAQRQFDQDWRFATLQDAREESTESTDPDWRDGATMGQLIASGPDQVEDTLYTLLVSGFFTSRKRILAVTPYFVPDATLLMSLTLAARRGVTVDLLMPMKSNHRLADLARHRALRELALAGGRIWFSPRMIHAKAIVIDDQLALVGSANLDERSLFLNYELMIAFYAPTEVERFAQWIEVQRNSAARHIPRPPGFRREIGEGLLLWLAFQL